MPSDIGSAASRLLVSERRLAEASVHLAAAYENLMATRELYGQAAGASQHAAMARARSLAEVAHEQVRQVITLTVSASSAVATYRKSLAPGNAEPVFADPPGGPDPSESGGGGRARRLHRDATGKADDVIDTVAEIAERLYNALPSPPTATGAEARQAVSPQAGPSLTPAHGAGVEVGAAAGLALTSVFVVSGARAAGRRFRAWWRSLYE